MQFRKVSDASKYSGVTNGNVSQSCEFGQFDYAPSNDENYENIYFDEIIGEVKMLVTIERDITTGQMLIRRTDYLE